MKGSAACPCPSVLAPSERQRHPSEVCVRDSQTATGPSVSGDPPRSREPFPVEGSERRELEPPFVAAASEGSWPSGGMLTAWVPLCHKNSSKPRSH